MANKSGIHIKPSHKGLLTKEVGKKGLSVSNLRKEIARDKASGNTAREKREVFALNAKTKFHHKDGGHVEGEHARHSLAKRARGGAFSSAHNTSGPEKGPEPATLARGGRARRKG